MSFDDKSPVLPAPAAGNMLAYLHIPFCEKLCPYCSFNRFVLEESLSRRYFKALRTELKLYKERGFKFTGVYVGGGTPTVLIDELEETIALARELFPLQEISVETNPNHLDDLHIGALQRIKVDRLSVGVQSFDDNLLKMMDRLNKYGSGKEIAQKLKDARGSFPTLNADMIFNFGSQDDKSLERDLDVLSALELDQVTYYPLMVSDSTRRAVEMAFGRVDYQKEERFYKIISARLVPPYVFSSVWCFSKNARMVDEYIVGYGDYAGLGSGSIGYLSGTCYANTFDLEQYISRLDKGEIPLMAARKFRTKERIRYEFLMSLFGMKLDMTAMKRKYDNGICPHLWYIISPFYLAGALRLENGNFYPTARGRYLGVAMMREFFTAVNNFRDYCRGGQNG